MNNILMLIADICGVIGMGFFLVAEIKQLWKILKTHVVRGISKTAYISKLIAIIFTSITLLVPGFYLSLSVILAEGLVIALVLYFMNKYKEL